MLVVIGIIGILAAVVLTALGPSRDKAKDTRIISAVNQVRSLAEVKYNATDNTYADISADGTFTQLSGDVMANGSTLNYVPAGATYTASAGLITDPPKEYCVDSTGFGGVIPGAPATPGSNCQ